MYSCQDYRVSPINALFFAEDLLFGTQAIAFERSFQPDLMLSLSIHFSPFKSKEIGTRIMT